VRRRAVRRVADGAVQTLDRGVEGAGGTCCGVLSAVIASCEPTFERRDSGSGFRQSPFGHGLERVGDRRRAIRLVLMLLVVEHVKPFSIRSSVVFRCVGFPDGGVDDPWTATSGETYDVQRAHDGAADDIRGDARGEKHRVRGRLRVQLRQALQQRRLGERGSEHAEVL